MKNILLATLQKFAPPDQIFRFFWSGLANSAITYVLYLGLNLVLTYQVAFTLSFIAGILIGAYIHGLYVFRVRVTFKKVVGYAVFYLASYLLSLWLLTLFVESFALPEAIAPIAVLFFVVPFNFLCARLVLTGRLLNDLEAENEFK